jgi:hypothetical protein
MSRNRRSSISDKIHNFFSISIALSIGILIGISIGFYNYTLIRSCLNGNASACIIMHNR